MEDPKRDCIKVVKALCDHPSLIRQAAAIRKYFTPDAAFYHYAINAGGQPDDGYDDIISIYQFAHVIKGYHKVELLHVAYDPEPDIVILRMNLALRPTFRLGWPGRIHILVQLELADYITEELDGGKLREKRVKRVKVQRDFFQRDPIIGLLPIIGDIYLSNTLRFVLGRIHATFVYWGRVFISLFLPADLSQGIFGLGACGEEELKAFGL